MKYIRITTILMVGIALFFSACSENETEDLTPKTGITTTSNAYIDIDAGAKKFQSHACTVPNNTKPATKCIAMSGDCRKSSDCTAVTGSPTGNTIPTIEDIEAMAIKNADLMVAEGYYFQEDWQIAHDFFLSYLISFYY